MKHRIGTILCAVSLLFGVIYPQETWAKDAFTNKDFLAMPDVQKKFWLSGAITTLGHVALVKGKKTSQCVYDWYFTDAAKKNGRIFAAMQKYPDYTPSSLIIVMLEKACGKFVQKDG